MDEDIVAKNHDYQNEMSVDTRSIDTAGEIAAAQVNADTQPVGTQKVRTDMGNNQTRVDTVGTFGVLPALHIPTEHARQRILFFKELATKTGARRNLLNAYDAAKYTAAYKSQEEMAKRYMDDETRIRSAQERYDTLVPLTEITARSLAKTNEIGRYTGFTDKKGPQLNNREARALSKAARKLHTPLDSNGSLKQASTRLIIARKNMFAKSALVAATAEDALITSLRNEYETAKEGRDAITKKIEQAQRVVDYFATFAATVSGGAGLVHRHLSPGTPDTKARRDAEWKIIKPEDPIGPKRRPPPKPPKPPKGPKRKNKRIKKADLRDRTIPAVETIADHAETAAEKASGAVAFGMNLYYEKEIAQLESQMQVAKRLLDAKDQLDARTKLEAAFTDFDASQMAYKDAVDTYQAVINDRRKDMAALGRTADRIADPRGKNSNASDAMLWTASVMETRSFASTAVKYGSDTVSNVEAAYAKVKATRLTPWGELEDIYDVTNLPRKEGLDSEDVVALRSMRQLVENFTEGAEALNVTMERVATKQAEPVLSLVGFTGEY